MAVITYTDSFTRADVAKLSLDSALWTGVTDGKCLSIRSNKLLSTWQDIIDGFHNADTAVVSPSKMPEGDIAFYSGRQYGSLTFATQTDVSMDATDPANAVYTDNFSGGPGVLGSNWSQNDTSGTWDWSRSVTGTLRGHETFLGAVASWAETTQMSSVLNQHSELRYKSGTPISIGPSVRGQGTGNSDQRYALLINASSWACVRNAGTNGSFSLSGLSGSLTLSANDLFKITAVDDGTGVQITAYQNGSVLGTAHYTFAGGSYLGSGKPGFLKDINTGGTMDVHFDDWAGGEIPSAAASASAVGTEIQFYESLYGVGYSSEEDSPSSHTYTRKVYIFTDSGYDEVEMDLELGDVLYGEVEIVDSLTCNVVAKVNNVEVLRIDGADRQTGRPSLRGTGSSPEQENYVDGLQARSEQTWSHAVLSLDALVPVDEDSNVASMATCVRTKGKAAWGKWKFSGTLRGFSVLDNQLVLSIERSTTMFVETIDISPVPGTRYLDCEILSADMASPTFEDGVTTWELPFDIPVGTDYPMVIVNTDTGEEIVSLTRTIASQISALGNFTDAIPVAIGLEFPVQWELSPLYITDPQSDGSTIAFTDGRLQIRFVEFNYERTGEFEVTVIPNTDDPSQNYTYTYTAASDSTKGTFRVPVLGQNTKSKVTVGGTSFRPFFVSNFSWTGYLSQKTKRV